MSRKTVFLTGAIGFLGSNILNQLLKQDYLVYCLVRPAEPEIEVDKGLKTTIEIIEEEQMAFARARLDHALEVANPDADFEHSQYPIILGDVSLAKMGIESESIIEAITGQIDAFLHCAGSISFSNKEFVWQINVEGTRKVLQFANFIHAKHFYYVGTAYVYGDKVGLIPETPFPCPDSKYNNLYEISKKFAEEIIFTQNYLPFSILRPGIVGPANDGSSLSFDGYLRYHAAFWELRNQIREGKYASEAITVNSNGKLNLPLAIKRGYDVTTNLTQVDWLGWVIAQIVDHDSEKNDGKIFNLTRENPPLVEWLIETSLDILEITGIQFVNPNIDVSHNDKLLDQWQRILDWGTRDYFAYRTQAKNFVNKMVELVLNSKYVEPPIVDRDYLERSLRYAESHGFQREKLTFEKWKKTRD